MELGRNTCFSKWVIWGLRIIW